MDATKIRAKFDSLVSLRKSVDQTWEAISKTMMPYRGNFFLNSESEHSVQWRNPRHIYDATAPMAIQTLSASLHGSLTSPATKWFELEFRDSELRADKESNVWLDNASNEVYMGLQDSNFNLEANEAYTDLVGYGTSVVVQEEDSENEGDYVFQATPVEQVFFEQDSKGQVCNFYRKLQWTAMQIVDKFGDDCPDHIKTKAKSADQANDKITLIFCIFKRANKEYDGSGILAPLERPYGSKYVIAESATQVGEEGGYYEMPAYVPRWRQTSDSMWGNSPAMMALPDVLTLNELVQLTLKSIEKVVDPATMVTERGLLSNLDLSAGGLTVVRNKDDVWSYESRARFDAVALQKNDLKASVRSAFYVDQLELKDSPAMTATEVQVRYELMQRLLGPTLGRLENDFLSPLIERSFRIKLRAGSFGDMPELMQTKGGQIDVKYTGPLARAQRKDSADSLVRWVMTLAQVSEVMPEVMDLPDPDEIAKLLGELEGVPAKVMKSMTKINTERKKRESQNAAMAEAEIGKTQGEAATAMAEAENVGKQ